MVKKAAENTVTAEHRKKGLRSLVGAALLAISLNVCAADFSGLVVLHTNDTHGYDYQQSFGGGQGSLGIGAVAALKRELTEKGYEVLLLDAGDCSQDNILVNYTQGLFAFELFSRAGYDAMCLGNHEFDYGQEVLRHNIGAASFPVLSSTVIEQSTGLPFTLTHTVFDMNCGRIGVIGFTTANTINSTAKENIRGLVFLTGKALYETAQKLVDSLKEQGCDLIIGLGHMGSEETNTGFRSDDVLMNVKGIDIFVDGHDHKVKNRMVNGALLVEAGFYTGNIGYISYEDGHFVEKMKSFSEYKDRYKDSVIDGMIAKESEKIERFLGKEIAFSEVKLDASREPGVRTEETNAGDFVADALLWQANELLKEHGRRAQLAIANGGGIRKTLEKGTVRVSDIMNMLPYQNRLAVITVSGAKLLEILESATCITPEASGGFPQVSGIEFSVNTAKPFEKGEKYADSEFYAPKRPGLRVSIKTVDGRAFNENDSYTLAVNSFIAEGGDSYAGLCEKDIQSSKTEFDADPAQAVLNYIEHKMHGRIDSRYEKSAGRIRILAE